MPPPPVARHLDNTCDDFCNNLFHLLWNVNGLRDLLILPPTMLAILNRYADPPQCAFFLSVCFRLNVILFSVLLILFFCYVKLCFRTLPDTSTILMSQGQRITPPVSNFHRQQNTLVPARSFSKYVVPQPQVAELLSFAKLLFRLSGTQLVLATPVLTTQDPFDFACTYFSVLFYLASCLTLE